MFFFLSSFLRPGKCAEMIVHGNQAYATHIVYMTQVGVFL